MIKRLTNILLCAVVAMAATAAEPALLPRPVAFTATQGTVAVPAAITVAGEGAARIAWQLSERGFQANVSQTPEAFVTSTIDAALPTEAYSLTIDPSQGVVIAASSDAGRFYAIETLTQMLEQGRGELQACTVADEPRFGYRGMMIDVVRCYLPIEEVKKLVDVASRLKINTLHLHLTDDNGWRIAIDRYPRLTEVGAWRVDRQELFPARPNPREGEEATYGGFYTKDELRDLVAYATDRCINIIPEIEMPAHAMGALASYPELACPVVDRYFGVTTGIGGYNASIIMCGGNDRCLEFVCNVLDEVAEVFPSPMIHLGGDEAAKDIWERCPLCQSRIAELGLDGCEGLQAWFMDRVNDHVRRLGRTAIGWDEVTYGRPEQDMVIMGWQGDGSVAVNYARETGRRFIMTPARSAYLIRYQGPQWFEPFTYFGNITLADAYSFEPTQPDWSVELRSQLLGVQGSMWTEFCRTPSDVQYMMYPRLMALADVAWRPEDVEDYTSFLAALDAFLPTLEAKGMTYARSMWNVQHTVRPLGDGRLELTAECVRPDAQISLNGTPYTQPVIVDSAQQLTLQSSSGDTYGQVLDLNVAFNKATGLLVRTDGCTNGQAYTLTNGLRGSLRSSDFEWAGWYNCPVDFTLNLDSAQYVDTVSLGVLANANMNIALPSRLRFYVATEPNDAYMMVAELKPADCYPLEAAVTDFTCPVGMEVRCIRIKADNPGPVPDGYPREGNNTWLYFDELMVD